MSRLSLRLGAAFSLLLAGAASTLLLPRPASGVGTTAAAPGSTAAPTTASSPAPVVLAVSGHGFGHGLGMSQWGAYGYALHGWSAARILAHYYTGTTLGHAPGRPVRVELSVEKKVTLASAVPWTVTDATGKKVVLAPGAIRLGASLAVPGHPLTPPLTFSAGSPLGVDSGVYRGKIELAPSGQKVQVVDVVALESYLRGVISAEMPYDWPAAALDAQAIAARSYALANLVPGASFDLFADVRSQVYGGVAAETPETDAAVAATNGAVVEYDGAVADTLFFSTSGGRTASSLEVTGKAVPYLVSVPDPYDTLSPFHDWGPVVLDGAKVVKRLGLSGPLAAVTVDAGPSGRASSVTVEAGGADASFTGADFGTLLQLRSTWFRTALYSLTPVTARVPFGGAVSLAGFAHGADVLALEQKPYDGAWEADGAITPAADGTFTSMQHPTVSTRYRLASGSVRACLVRVTVTARVTVTPGASGLSGDEAPATPAPVELQAKSGSGWRTVSATSSDDTGAWRFAGSLAAGTYRVGSDPGGGVAAGYSVPFQVS